MTGPEHVHDLLAYYADLTPAERRHVDAHLAACADCRATQRAYERQDAALAALPELRPRARAWRAPAGLRWQWLGRVGDVLVIAGLAALLWMLPLQLQYASQWSGAQPASPVEVVPEPGLVLPVTAIRPPSPWLPALPWVGGALLVVGVLFVLGRHNRWPATVGAAVSAILLVTYVPPLSALPNPAALYWRAVGGYTYDPNLPFKNSFLIAGDPAAQLRPHLDALLGEVGLSPLHPEQPLAGYEILRVGLHPRHNRVALVTTRFIYADGTSRVYPVPLFSPATDMFGFLLGSWQEIGLERLASQHLALPGQPFADEASPIRVGPARRLDGLSTAAHRLDEANPNHWLWDAVRLQRLVFAPGGGEFLALIERGPADRQLWRVPLDGREPALVATGIIYQYGWSPDGGTIVYTQFDRDASTVQPRAPYAILAVPSAGGRPQVLATGLWSEQLPGLTEAGVWFFADSSLWLAPYAGGAPQLIAGGLGLWSPSGAPRPSPDGTRVLFQCDGRLCVLSGNLLPKGVAEPDIHRFEDFNFAEATWTPDSAQAAVIDRNPNFASPVSLVVLTRDGEVPLRLPIAPLNATEAPQWTPDQQAIFIQTYPFDGRRIIAVHLPTQQVLDLSQEHWDAYFTLTPDGQHLLLNNGRGDYWMAEVIRGGQ